MINLVFKLFFENQRLEIFFFSINETITKIVYFMIIVTKSKFDYLYQSSDKILNLNVYK